VEGELWGWICAAIPRFVTYKFIGVVFTHIMQKGDAKQFASAFKKAKEAGFGITLHIAEVPAVHSLTLFCFTSRFQIEALSSAAESAELLSFMPDRLGHATYLDDEAKKIVIENNVCVEICLSSNILCVCPFCRFMPLINLPFKRQDCEIPRRSSPSLLFQSQASSSHLCTSIVASDFPQKNVDITFQQTDDTLPFQNSVLGEYALLLAAPPHGFGMKEDDIVRLAGMSMKNRFTSTKSVCPLSHFAIKSRRNSVSEVPTASESRQLITIILFIQSSLPFLVLDHEYRFCGSRLVQMQSCKSLLQSNRKFGTQFA
jgi:hypothetical protein